MTPDGRQVIFGTVGNQDLMMLALDGTRRVQPLLETPSVERNGVVSPDGRWLAYESDSAGAIRDLRPAVSQRERGAMADLDGRRHAAALGAAAARSSSMWRPMARSWLCVSTPRGAKWSSGSPAKVVEGPYVTRKPP